MDWYFPSWNGDIRIEVDPKDDKRTIFTMIEPTADEKRVLQALAKIFNDKKWIKRKTLWNPRGNKKRQETVVNAPIFEIGTLMIAHLKPGLATLTAIQFESGKVEAMGSGERGILKWLAKLFGASNDGKADIAATADVADALEESLNKDSYREPAPEPPKKDKPKKAATVKRPTPSCPRCFVDAVEPATEVLLSFLDEEQHEQWAHNRSIIVTGGLTGHRYLLAHRHSKNAAKMGKICMDLDDHGVLHFHDWSVPPEEEVLAAMLILQHREPWLRNEATCLGMNGQVVVWDYLFKNPFGNGKDGVADSTFTGELGDFLRGYVMGAGHKEEFQRLWPGV